jgi:hypothetical protein
MREGAAIVRVLMVDDPGGNIRFSGAVKTEMETGIYTIKVRYASPQINQPILDKMQFMAQSVSSCPRKKTDFS